MVKKKMLASVVLGGRKSAKAVLKEINPLDVLKVYFDYRKTAETQVTERERIWSERDKALAAIEAEKELLLFYFKQRFKERSRTLERFFELLSDGASTKDATKIDGALEGILAIVKDSPLKDFANFQKARKDGRIIDI